MNRLFLTLFFLFATPAFGWVITPPGEMDCTVAIPESVTTFMTRYGPSAPAGIIVPLYIWPGASDEHVYPHAGDPTAWDADFIEFLGWMRAYKEIPRLVTLNPASGPGTATCAYYTAAIRLLSAEGAQVLGYLHVNENEGVLDVPEAIMALTTWKSLYPRITGAFISMDYTDAITQEALQELVAEARALGFNYLVAHSLDVLDWTVIQNTPVGNYARLSAAHDNTWLYLRLDLLSEANPFAEGGFAWHFDANAGSGFDMFDQGAFFSDALLMSAGPWATAQEQRAGVWQGGELLDGDAGGDYKNLIALDWYQPFDTATDTLHFRIDRSHLYHNTIGAHLFASDDDPQTLGIGVRSAGHDWMWGSYTIPDPDSDNGRLPDVDDALFSLFDVVGIFEGANYPGDKDLGADMEGLAFTPAWKRAVFVHSRDIWDASAFNRLVNHAGFVYVTEIEPMGTWNNLSAYMTNMLDFLALRSRVKGDDARGGIAGTVTNQTDLSDAPHKKADAANRALFTADKNRMDQAVSTATWTLLSWRTNNMINAHALFEPRIIAWSDGDGVTDDQPASGDSFNALKYVGDDNTYVEASITLRYLALGSDKTAFVSIEGADGPIAYGAVVNAGTGSVQAGKVFRVSKNQLVFFATHHNHGSSRNVSGIPHSTYVHIIEH